MKVAIISTSDIVGGASRAAYTLCQGLQKIGVEAKLVVMRKAGTDTFVFQAPAAKQSLRLRIFKLMHDILLRYFRLNRTSLSNTLFSLPYPGVDISEMPEIRQADIINMHWVAGFQSPVTIRKLLNLEIPIVWTLHDQFAYSGGCHYAAGCIKFTTDCQSCPQLKKDFAIPQDIVSEKVMLYKNSNLAICAPSRWVKDAVKSSKVFADHSVAIIPYSIDEQIFKPMNKVLARKKLGIESSAFTIIFGSDNGNEKRKGFDFLLEALHICFRNQAFDRAAQNGKVRLLVMGEPNNRLSGNNWPIHYAGRIHTDADLNVFYAAGDVLIAPSIEDTLPLTMLEAMSSGTPAIAFDSETAGMRDVIRSGKDGILVPSGNSAALAEALIALFLQPAKLRTMQKSCRKTIETSYYYEREAQDYRNLFRKILKKPKPSPASVKAGEFGFLFNRRLPWVFLRVIFTTTFLGILLRHMHGRGIRILAFVRKKILNRR